MTLSRVRRRHRHPDWHSRVRLQPVHTGGPRRAGPAAGRVSQRRVHLPRTHLGRRLIRPSASDVRPCARWFRRTPVSGAGALGLHPRGRRPVGQVSGRRHRLIDLRLARGGCSRRPWFAVSRYSTFGRPGRACRVVHRYAPGGVQNTANSLPLRIEGTEWIHEPSSSGGSSSGSASAAAIASQGGSRSCRCQHDAQLRARAGRGNGDGPHLQRQSCSPTITSSKAKPPSASPTSETAKHMAPRWSAMTGPGRGRVAVDRRIGSTTVTLASSGVSTGESVVAIGNAGGKGGTPSYAAGTVTGTNQSITASDEATGASEQLTGLIETDADIVAGDSGGPLVNSSGQVARNGHSGSSGIPVPIAGKSGLRDPG